jgi:hypothetical protein
MNPPSLVTIRPAAQAPYRRLPHFGELLDAFAARAKSKGYTDHSVYL